MGRLIFVIEEKVLLIFFTVPLFFFFLAAQELLKIKVCVEPCLVSVVVLMRGCSGTGEYETGKNTNNAHCDVCWANRINKCNLLKNSLNQPEDQLRPAKVSQPV